MKKLVIGNLKMNILAPSERDEYLESFSKELKSLKSKSAEVILCPPFIYLEKFADYFKRNKKINVGAQDVFWEKEGSYTGEISAEMIKNAGGRFVIIGHSERRRYFGESDETANLKIKAAIKSGICPVYCIGESGEERKMNLTKVVLIRQLQEGLKDISRVNLEKIIIAYEPVWSVGTDEVPTCNEIMEAKLLIRKILTEEYGSKYALETSIIYGGSVNYRTADHVCISPAMDGVLVGRESLVPSEFIKIATLLNG